MCILYTNSINLPKKSKGTCGLPKSTNSNSMQRCHLRIYRDNIMLLYMSGPRLAHVKKSCAILFKTMFWWVYLLGGHRVVFPLNIIRTKKKKGQTRNHHKKLLEKPATKRNLATTTNKALQVHNISLRD